jgi:FkbM family methyltransferase
VRKLLKKIARRFGYDILHLPTDPIARQWLDLINAYQINLIFDVGANAGQFGQRVRALGYKGKLVSFEPMADVYRQLQATSANDSDWDVVHSGIGDYNGTATINVSANSYSSSVLNILPLHVESAPDSIYTRQEPIQVQTIDTFVGQYYVPGKNLYIKIDTQGFERQVFEGCLKSLDKISGFQMELSLRPLYEGETLLDDMLNLLRENGYKLKLIDGGHRNYETGELLQVEGYFFK